MKTWSFISLRKFRKLQNLLCFFGFQWPNNRLKMMSASLNDQNYPRYPLVLNLNVTLAWPLRLVILYFFKWKILSDDRRLYFHNSKWNSRSDVDGLTHTKQLLNLLCIVYNVPECFYHERSTKEPSYQRDTSAKRLITTTTTTLVLELLFYNRSKTLFQNKSNNF